MPDLTITVSEDDARRLAHELEDMDQPRRDQLAYSVQKEAARWCEENPPLTPRHNYATSGAVIVSARELRLGDLVAGERVRQVHIANGVVTYWLHGCHTPFRVPANGLAAIGSASVL